ncbi:hypothetical protein AX16_003147 [Volvariella volvacea WC 439]|nr:hypothetical protein AX16_003147 [Volvariella volvacea WC 439]
MEESSWKHLKLSLERPYKADDGKLLPVLSDITPDGQHIYESQDDPTHALGEKLRRIFAERGIDFFDHDRQRHTQNEDTFGAPPSPDSEEETQGDGKDTPRDGEYMTFDELTQMRREIDRHLFIAAGEIYQARELLNMLLPVSSTDDNSSARLTPLAQPYSSVLSGQATADSPPTLAATVITKSPSITSVKCFNSQLIIGGKDEGLRKAADVFKQAAKSMERSRILGEQYWVDALRIRRANWTLIPAPLPYGSATGKGADKTSKDFLVSFGLEESPPSVRRWAVGHLSTSGQPSVNLVVPHRQNVQLRIALAMPTQATQKLFAINTPWPYDQTSLDGALASAQQEIVDREIFLHLIEEAGRLPSASARVSERLIVIEAAHGVELKFELVEIASQEALPTEGHSHEICDLVYHSLRVLLLRRHEYLKLMRLGHVLINPTRTPAILQPIIDFIQYQVFCEKVYAVLSKTAKSLLWAGVPTQFKFDAVMETGKELVRLLSGHERGTIGGEAWLRIDKRYTIRLSFALPASLTAHLSQGILSVSSIPQLHQLLADEVNRCLLHRIHELGNDYCSSLGGVWFVDLNRCIGRWDGGVVNFQTLFKNDFTVDCSAFRLDSATSKQGEFHLFSARVVQSESLLAWVARIIRSVPPQS